MEIKKFETGMIGTNTYVVADEASGRCAIIDPGAVNPAIEAYIEEKSFIVESIILTHAHADHIGGVAYYREKYHATVFVHEQEVPILEDPKLNYSREVLRQNVSLSADTSVKHGDEIAVGSILFQVIHTPGHTPGGICLLSGNVLFSGDSLFRDSIGRTDFPYCDTAALLQAIKERLFILPEDVTVYPGHMGATSIGYEKQNNPFIR